ncbi:MAG: hypothetical protein H7Y18_00215 [Clostridiaceae bacterium]|nr:hypothetical protein [Clostridiaceae bacterium]
MKNLSKNRFAFIIVLTLLFTMFLSNSVFASAVYTQTPTMNNAWGFAQGTAQQVKTRYWWMDCHY